MKIFNVKSTIILRVNRRRIIQHHRGIREAGQDFEYKEQVCRRPLREADWFDVSPVKMIDSMWSRSNAMDNLVMVRKDSGTSWMLILPHRFPVSHNVQAVEKLPDMEVGRETSVPISLRNT